MPFLLLAILVAAQLALAGQALWSAGSPPGRALGPLWSGEARRRRRGAALPPSLRAGRRSATRAGSRWRCRCPACCPAAGGTVGAKTELGRRWIGKRGRRPSSWSRRCRRCCSPATRLPAARHRLRADAGRRRGRGGGAGARFGALGGQAARDALPGWAATTPRSRSRGGRVTVRLRPPSLRGIAERLAVSGSARRGRDERRAEPSCSSPGSGRPRARGRPPRRWPAPDRSPIGPGCWSSSDGRAPRPALVATAAARRARGAARGPPARGGARRARPNLPPGPAGLTTGDRAGRRRRSRWSATRPGSSPSAVPARDGAGEQGRAPLRSCCGPTSGATGRSWPSRCGT